MSSMRPKDLEAQYLTDALVSYVEIDTLAQTAHVTIEVDPKFHVSFCHLLPDSGEETLLADLIFSGVKSIRFSKLSPRNVEIAGPRKPFEYEIAKVSVSQLLFDRTLYRAELRFFLGQILTLTFRGLDVAPSRRMAGQTQDDPGVGSAERAE